MHGEYLGLNCDDAQRVIHQYAMPLKFWEPKEHGNKELTLVKFQRRDCTNTLLIVQIKGAQAGILNTSFFNFMPRVRAVTKMRSCFSLGLGLLYAVLMASSVTQSSIRMMLYKKESLAGSKKIVEQAFTHLWDVHGQETLLDCASKCADTKAQRAAAAR